MRSIRLVAPLLDTGGAAGGTAVPDRLPGLPRRRHRSPRPVLLIAHTVPLLRIAHAVIAHAVPLFLIAHAQHWKPRPVRSVAGHSAI